MAPCPADLRAKDHYRVLGVDKGTTDAELARAYKRLALKYHPDKNPENKETAEASFRKVAEAYEVLRDPEKRRRYDTFGPAGLEGAGPGVHGGFSRNHADNIFNAFFGGPDWGPKSDYLFSTPCDYGDPFGLGGGLLGGEPSRFSFDTGAGAPGRPRRAAHAAHAKPPGVSVVVRGLTKAPEHNGRSAQICRWDEARERYDVRLDAGDMLSLRPGSVVQLCAVEVTALESRPELNGLRGRIFGFDEARGRYRVLLDDLATAVALQPANCVLLDEGVRVVLRGLSSSPELNGQMAQVRGVERASSRYTVCSQGGRCVKVKYDNVIC